MFKDPLTDFALDQADILEDVIFPGPKRSLRGIVVTPVCDIAQDKADYITLCAVLPAFDALDVFLERTWEGVLGIKRGTTLSGSKRKELMDKIRRIFGGQAIRYFWLNPFPNQSEPNLVDFQIIASILFSELTSKTRLLGMKSPWREALPARFAAYTGRVGLPRPATGTMESQITPWLDSRFPKP